MNLVRVRSALRSAAVGVVTASLALPTSAVAQTNPQFTFSLDGPCGTTVVGPPGSVYDDGTLGLPWFGRGRAGHIWQVVLTASDNPMKEGAWGWSFSLGAEGPIRISDITTNGTAGCYRMDPFPECQVWAGGAVFYFLTGPPDGAGPQTEENVGAASWVMLKWDGVVRLPNHGPVAVCKIRVTGRFPATVGEVATGRVFFTTKEIRTDGPLPPQVFVTGSPITLEEGDPPLEVEECVFHLKASDVGAFLRCDANDDGGVSLSDAVWILNELFLGGAATRCRPAADCDGNGAREVSDAVYALSHLFLGGPEPPPPYRFCDRIDVPVEECPPGATACP